MSKKVAIIGAGRMGRRHIAVVRKMGLRLIGIMDQSPASLEQAKAEHDLNGVSLVDNRESLYAADIPDCLIIATTADSHCELVCEAAARGVNFILVEKPLAVSLSECETMIATCKKHGAQLAVNHQMRFMDQYVKPKELLSSAAYGGFKSMTVVAGNFGLAMNATHYFEAFRYMSDEDPYEVAAWFSPDLVPNPRGPQFVDRAGSIRLVTVGGKRFYLEASADQGHGVQVVYAGRNGTITVNELTGEMITSVRQAEYAELPTTRYGMPAIENHEKIAPAELVESTEKVLSALLTGGNSVTAEHGLLPVKILVAAYTSSENGGIPLRLDGSLDSKRVFPWA
jgi:predicted dehydrogenase